MLQVVLQEAANKVNGNMGAAVDLAGMLHQCRQHRGTPEDLLAVVRNFIPEVPVVAAVPAVLAQEADGGLGNVNRPTTPGWTRMEPKDGWNVSVDWTRETRFSMRNLATAARAHVHLDGVNWPGLNESNHNIGPDGLADHKDHYGFQKVHIQNLSQVAAIEYQVGSV